MKEMHSSLPSVLAEFFTRISGEKDTSIKPLLEALHNALLKGSSCLHTDSFPENFSDVRENLIMGSPEADKPLVLAPEGNLYFRRYFEYERSLASSILRLANTTSGEIAPSALARLQEYFDGREDQMAAAQIAMTQGISLITGGPGTGKTYLAVGVMAALLANDSDLRIALAAPTGKAAQRLRESIEKNLPRFPLEPEIAERFPTDAKTIHRLLRPLPPSIHFRHNAERPLHADVVVVDESSMIDLPLMTKLFDALKPGGRIILLGDADQLAPVEAGAPFASIAAHFSSQQTTNAFAKLEQDARFKEGSSIPAFCQRVRSVETEEAVALLATDERADLQWHHGETRENLNALEELIEQGYGQLQNAPTPEEALSAFLGFQILCATNQGLLGVNALNELAEKALGIDAKDMDKKGRYSGLPILVESNDYSLDLFNGDVGILFSSTGKPADLLAWFPREDGSLRSISPARLPKHRPAYAMTIHRSQGSEYEQVAVVLPDRESEILNRNLLYVAVSRAKEKVTLFASQDILTKTIETQARLGSGLEFRLDELAGI